MVSKNTYYIIEHKLGTHNLILYSSFETLESARKQLKIMDDDKLNIVKVVG